MVAQESLITGLPRHQRDDAVPAHSLWSRNHPLNGRSTAARHGGAHRAGEPGGAPLCQDTLRLWAFRGVSWCFFERFFEHVCTRRAGEPGGAADDVGGEARHLLHPAGETEAAARHQRDDLSPLSAPPTRRLFVPAPPPPCHLLHPAGQNSRTKERRRVGRVGSGCIISLVRTAIYCTPQVRLRRRRPTKEMACRWSWATRKLPSMFGPAPPPPTMSSLFGRRR